MTATEHRQKVIDAALADALSAYDIAAARVAKCLGAVDKADALRCRSRHRGSERARVRAVTAWEDSQLTANEAQDRYEAMRTWLL